MATQIGGQLASAVQFDRVYSFPNHRKSGSIVQFRLGLMLNRTGNLNEPRITKFSIQCSEKQTPKVLRTCRNCKTQFEPLLNHPRACCYHTAHFGGTLFHSTFTSFVWNEQC